jgi:hypothetical protein
MSTETYLERRSALRWPLVAWGLVLPAVLVAVVVLLVVFGGSGSPLDAILPVILGLGLVAALVGDGLLYRNWPTGIRVDERGVSIGAVGSGRAALRRPTVTHQNWGLFSCPWPDIKGMTVETDPWKIREIKKSPQYWTLSNRWGKPRQMTACKLGVLTAPFMKAALLIDVGYDEGTGPELRPAVFFANFVSQPKFSSRIGAEPSAVWVVPTRRPDELRSFLLSGGHGNPSGEAPPGTLL